jgi:hypothetical protein
VNSILYLQRTIGNQAVQRMLQTHAEESGVTAAASPRFGYHFSQIPLYPREAGAIQIQMPPVFPAPRLPGPIQANLNVGAIDDRLEHEADRVADQVVRMPAAKVSVAASSPQVSRNCGACEDEEKLRKKPGGPRVAGGEAPAIVHEVLCSPGQPLDAATRAYFEPRFGHDFSHVRVHTGTSAEQSARDVNAHAYTVGHDIAFGPGRSAPGTQEERRLIAHELTHVVQQAWVGPSLQRQPQPPRPDLAPKLSPFVSADLVREIKRDNETWMLTIDGFSDPDSVRRLIWPNFAPLALASTSRSRSRTLSKRDGSCSTASPSTPLSSWNPPLRSCFPTTDLKTNPKKPRSLEMRALSSSSVMPGNSAMPSYLISCARSTKLPSEILNCLSRTINITRTTA